MKQRARTLKLEAQHALISCTNLSACFFPPVSVCPADQELFSGMYIDFMGTDAAIFRSLTRRNAVRTDQHNSKWLSG